MAKSKSGFFDTIRAVLIATINKGQLPILLLFTIALVLVIKLPSERVPGVINTFIEGLENYHLLGWVLTVISSFGWVFTARWQRRVHSAEMDRVSDEKSKMQQDKMQIKLSSTKKSKKNN